MGKRLMVPCASPIKPHQPVLQKGYRGQGLGSALHCHHTARAGRSIGTGGWETEVMQCDFGSARVLLSWHGGVVFLLAQFSAHPSYCLTPKVTVSSVRNKLRWSIHTSALPGFLSVPLPQSPNHGIFTYKSHNHSQSAFPRHPGQHPAPTLAPSRTCSGRSL